MGGKGEPYTSGGNYVLGGGCCFGGRAVIGRLMVRFLAPESYELECSWAKY